MRIIPIPLIIGVLILVRDRGRSNDFFSAIFSVDNTTPVAEYLHVPSSSCL